MKNSRFNRFSAISLAAISLVASVSFAPKAQAATDTSFTNQTISTAIDDVDGPNTVTKTTTATATLSGNNTFSGGLFIKAGTVLGNTNTTAFGAGIIYLGDTTGSSNVTLNTNAASGLIYANPITVVGGNTGVATITSSSRGGFSGAITLSSHDLTVSSLTAFGLTFSGGVTGTGNLTINSTGGGGNTTFSTASVNHIGIITHSSTVGTGGVISGGVGSNVTAINQNSATIGLTINTNALTVKSTGTTLNSGNAGAFSVTSAVAGTGDLILNANSTGVIGLAAVNHAGTITNSGTGTGTVTISGTIGTNVTGVTQNSATSTLSLTGINTYAGVFTLGTGTVSVGSVGNGLAAGNLGAASNATSNLIFDGGTLAITGSGSSDRAFTINAGKTATINVAGSQSFAGATGAATNGTLVKLGAGTLALTGASTFTGGLTINAGTMQGNGNAAAFGDGTITLGDNTGSSNVTLTTNAASGLIYANPITVAGGNTGLASITSTSQGGFSGAITLSSHDLTVSSQTAYGLTFSGGVTGTGNLTINSTGGGGNTTFSIAAVNHSGTITHSSTVGTGGVISGGVGSNVTAINQNSSTIGLTIQTNALTVNSAGTTLNSGNAAAFSVTSAVAGTGNFIVNANSTGVIGLGTTTINHTGSITNSGTGTGTVTISGVIGTNVTGVTQNSATSALTLTGTNTYSGDTTVSAGTLSLTKVNSNNESSKVTIATGAFLNLNHALSDTVGTFFIDAVQQAAGTYVADGTQTGLEIGTPRITGTGKLVVSSGSAPNPYAAWAGGAGFHADANGDGVPNGLAWILGASEPSAYALAFLPVPGQSGGNLTMTFTQVAPMAPAKLFVEYSNDLGGSDLWHSVQVPSSEGISTVSDVTFTITGTSPTQSVSVSVPASKAAAGKIFGRLRSAEN